MAIRILIDGYNLIRNFPPLARAEQYELARGRETLLEWLADYRRAHPGPITVVFDGGRGGSYQEEHDLYRGIKITFSAWGQTADEVIKGLVTPKADKTLVVSSDRELMDYCRGRGAGVIGSREFANRLQVRIAEVKNPEEKEEPERYPTPKKKKGLARRPSKKAKREMKYWGKI